MRQRVEFWRGFAAKFACMAGMFTPVKRESSFVGFVTFVVAVYCILFVLVQTPRSRPAGPSKPPALEERERPVEGLRQESPRQIRETRIG